MKEHDSSLVRIHEFNSSWWKHPVGIISNPHAIKTAATDAIKNSLDGYDWVEFKTEHLDEETTKRLVHHGFFVADTQIEYKISLRDLDVKESKNYDAEWANDVEFSITLDCISDFKSERFLRLPGATQAKVNERYIQWAHCLLNTSPSTCLQIRENNDVQGWVFAQPLEHSQGVNFCIAMLKRNSALRGIDFYRYFMHAFSERGFSFGKASFSVNNTAVHNIHSLLGVRFLTPTSCWFWINPKLQNQTSH